MPKLRKIVCAFTFNSSKKGAGSDTTMLNSSSIDGSINKRPAINGGMKYCKLQSPILYNRFKIKES